MGSWIRGSAVDELSADFDPLFSGPGITVDDFIFDHGFEFIYI